MKHLFTIFFPFCLIVNSPLADQARQMLRDCVYDLNEMRQCRDCYRRSNEKTSKNWFCEPCDPPHLLVYAKQKGYPFWPAKVNIILKCCIVIYIVIIFSWKKMMMYISHNI
jgi:hypothetical protein